MFTSATRKYLLTFTMTLFFCAQITQELEISGNPFEGSTFKIDAYSNESVDVKYGENWIVTGHEVDPNSCTLILENGQKKRLSFECMFVSSFSVLKTNDPNKGSKLAGFNGTPEEAWRYLNAENEQEEEFDLTCFNGQESISLEQFLLTCPSDLTSQLGPDQPHLSAPIFFNDPQPGLVQFVVNLPTAEFKEKEEEERLVII